MRRAVPTALLLLLPLAAGVPAHAATGGVEPGSSQGANGGASESEHPAAGEERGAEERRSAPKRDNGAAEFGRTPPESRAEKRRKARERKRRARERKRRARERRRRARARRDRGRPLLEAFSTSPSRFYAYGASLRVRFRIADRSDTVRVTLVVARPGSRKVLRRYDLGDMATGVDHTHRLNGMSGGALPQGALEVRISARDPGRLRMRSAADVSSAARTSFYWHRHPVRGPFTYGGDGGRFGDPRPGRLHRGQDLSAPSGTPLVAPRGGVVEVVAYQAEGAGHYVVLDGAGEDRDYVFMHLLDGSIRVRQGQRVRTGQLLGRVGSTGASSGPHLHFEIWEGGGWFSGGHPIDPLPYLLRWDRWS